MMRRLAGILPRLGESGRVAVEYALCVPFLVAMMYGIIEVSHYAYLRTTMENVAHDAVRYAAIHSSQAQTPATASDVKTFTNSGMTAPASVPQVMTVESFHHSVVSPPRSGMMKLETT